MRPFPSPTSCPVRPQIMRNPDSSSTTGSGRGMDGSPRHERRVGRTTSGDISRPPGLEAARHDEDSSSPHSRASREEPHWDKSGRSITSANVIFDRDGDVVMGNSAPVIHVPIFSISEALCFGSCPTAQDASRRVHFRSSSQRPSLFLYNYFDLYGLPAVQPVSGHAQELDEYFEQSSSRDGHGGKMLRAILVWCCWAQSNHSLSHELRWLLTYIYDSVNIILYSAETGLCIPGCAEFWTNRNVLFQQLARAENLLKHKGVENMMIARARWDQL
ncbi:uncharacterized protein B0I36DRAFT_65492 [Microdochium trichocladiopsis]|uniref:Uncharacterized protein n=1 Tax=Microdochium trichocladiopsis TaxID=1682393 RepID=A0A9P8YE95_9PEZI|nr:uncharacterized protein B0I36DRAFT_65492 [Microdochium trichocladiopsis]KAH7037401.1 hypothetical protein B0I36DRAFT_65492 [Microdochium trichocladiopsis]